jgi:hypothetical protein
MASRSESKRTIAVREALTGHLLKELLRLITEYLPVGWSWNSDPGALHPWLKVAT